MSIEKRFKLFIFKLVRWEFWPNKIVYFIPVCYLFYLALKTRSLGFFSAANPTIIFGGLLNTSKYNIYKLIPEKYYPKTLLFSPKIDLDYLFGKLNSNNIHFPFIVKPDLGFQGIGVEVINSKFELEQYVLKTKYNFIAQPFIDLPNEIGIFYCRLPNDANGEITGIVSKEFPFIKGDGVSTLIELIEKDERLLSQITLFDFAINNHLNTILPNEEIFYLTKIGNHARGTKFIDASKYKTEKLNMTIDRICKKIPMFYYGRIDIKYQNFEDLENGINFYIIELNGAMSLPTHMYDAQHSLFYAWSEMIRHFKYLNIIARQNNEKGHKYSSFKEFVTMIKIYFKNSKTLLSN
jgi:hypothetical protein